MANKNNGYQQNLKLNKLQRYVQIVCKNCGRSYPETVLNIEGWVHHKTPPTCLNKRECQRVAHKKKIKHIKKHTKYIKPINQ